MKHVPTQKDINLCAVWMKPDAVRWQRPCMPQPFFCRNGLISPGLDDSKKLSAKKRESLYDAICSQAVAWCVASASEQEIDEVNILQATFLAMRRAVEGLHPAADYALIDGNRMPPPANPGGNHHKGGFSFRQHLRRLHTGQSQQGSLYGGNGSTVPAISICKTQRIRNQAACGTVKKYGPCPIHRRSFLKKILTPEETTAWAEAMRKEKRENRLPLPFSNEKATAFWSAIIV